MHVGNDSLTGISPAGQLSDRVCDGAIFCIRWSLYRPVLPELANDLELPLGIRHAGYWTRYEPGAENDINEFVRRRRICD